MSLQQIASYMALAVYWLIGLPLSAIFAFKCDFGVRGLLAGFLVATALQALAYLGILLKTNW